MKDEKSGEMKNKVTAFIVERAFGGVTRYWCSCNQIPLQSIHFVVLLLFLYFVLFVLVVHQKTRWESNVQTLLR